MLGQLSSVREKRKEAQAQHKSPRDKLRNTLHAVRFMVRMQIGAKRWAKHDKVRQRLADCIEEMQREERIKKARDIWRAQTALSPSRRSDIKALGQSVADG